MDNRRWYVVQTYSGYENSVQQDLLKRIETMGQQDYIFNVLVPEEEYQEEKKVKNKETGETETTMVTKTRKMFPSYVFVEMIVTEKSWFIVRNTPKVTGFLGSSGKGAKPVPIPTEEINEILAKLNLIEKPVYDYAPGQLVLVVDGPFKDKVVEIASVDEAKEIITFMVEFFGRMTPAEVHFNEVKKYDGDAKESEDKEEVQSNDDVIYSDEEYDDNYSDEEETDEYDEYDEEA